MEQAAGAARKGGGIGRSIGAVVAGVLAAGVLVAAVQWVGHQVYPPPPGLDPTNPESIRALMDQIPAGALLFVLLAWAVGTCAGGAVAARIAGKKPTGHALVVGLILLAFGTMNLVMIPHPRWFNVVGVLVFLPAAYVGARLGAPGS